MKALLARPGFLNALKALLLLVTGLILVVWLYLTPPGLLGKADAVGYAVCHRITARSFLIGERSFPLCARCSGMYLAALLGLLLQIPFGRRGGMPPLKILIVLGLFLAGFGIDGVNSYMKFFPKAPVDLYTPQNWLRLATGMGVGLGLAAVLYPIFNQTVWQDWHNRPTLESWRQLGYWLLCAALVALATLSQNPLLLYPLALLSSATILIILTLVYTMVWAMISKRDNTSHSLKELWPLLVAGFATALTQIALMDLLRYLWTGTWDGFVL